MVTTQRWTIHDLAQFEQPLDDTRYELIDGELYVSTQPDWRHQFAGTRIWAASIPGAAPAEDSQWLPPA